MALPRRVLRGTYLVTRRCALRKFLLKPSAKVEQVFAYCLGLAAERFGVLVHSLVVLSNHYHLVVSDPRCQLPRFMHWLNTHLAKAMNVAYGRGESFFSPGSYSKVTLGDPAAVLDKLAYVITNAVAAGLVASPAEWPGLRALPEDVGARMIEAARPSWFFAQPRDDHGPDHDAANASARARRRRMEPDREPLPERVRLAITRPPGFDDLSDAGFRALLAERVAARVAELHERRAREGKVGWLGVDAILAQHHEDSPGSTWPDGSLNPRVACRDKWRRIELLEAEVSFWAEHAEARARFRAGERDVLFPAGTWWLRVHLGARCRDAA
jgi:REP element-mobilizing transposase RayT